MAESRETFLERLKRLKACGAPWHEIARALRDRPEANDARVWKPFLAEAGRSTGLSPVVLARYVSLLDRLHAIAPTAQEYESLLPPKFSSGEIAVRLHESDPVKGRKALKDLRTGDTTLEKLRHELSMQTMPRSRGRGRSLRERASTIEELEKLLISRAGRLFGAGSSMVRRPALRHLVRDGFEVRSPNDDVTAGLDLYLPEPAASGRDPLDALARSVLLSFYLPRFFLAFAPGFKPNELLRAERILDVFKAPWIGMLEITDKGTVSLFRGTFSPPKPDRSREYADLVAGLRHRLTF
jgi:hypothetical protein